jgi:hypothetical protein
LDFRLFVKSNNQSSRADQTFPETQLEHFGLLQCRFTAMLLHLICILVCSCTSASVQVLFADCWIFLACVFVASHCSSHCPHILLQPIRIQPISILPSGALPFGCIAPCSRFGAMAPKQAAIEEAIHCWCYDIPLTDEALAAIDTAIGNLEEGDLRIEVFQNIRREAIQQRGLSAEVVAASLGTSGSYGGGAASGNGKGSASGDHGGAGKGTATVIFRRPAAAKAEGGKGAGSGVLRRPAAVQAEGGKGGKGGRKGR